MKRILISLSVIGAVVAIAASTGTIAFFSDTETSSGNTFTAGDIDLKIDNTSYYNGAAYPSSTWQLDDLADASGTRHLFFQFADLKPQDWGEDTISLHPGSNDAWACMAINRTKDDDMSSTEPELEIGDLPEDASSTFDGELGNELQFAFWNDDGDNVLEVGETVFVQGSSSQIFDGDWWSLADSNMNIWGGSSSTPLTGGGTYYVGKAWCFGDLGLAPVPAGQGVNPTVNSGIECDGAAVTNMSQTDMTMADVKFYATQARNNGQFLCSSLNIQAQ